MIETISLSEDMLIWVIPSMIIFLAIMTKRIIPVIVAFLFGAFSFLYLAYSSGNFIYAFASVVCIASSVVLSYEQLVGGD